MTPSREVADEEVAARWLPAPPKPPKPPEPPKPARPPAPAEAEEGDKATVRWLPTNKDACATTTARLADFGGRRLSAEEWDEMSHHLAECPSCRATVQDIGRALAMIGNDGAEPADTDELEAGSDDAEAVADADESEPDAAPESETGAEPDAPTLPEPDDLILLHPDDEEEGLDVELPSDRESVTASAVHDDALEEEERIRWRPPTREHELVVSPDEEVVDWGPAAGEADASEAGATEDTIKWAPSHPTGATATARVDQDQDEDEDGDAEGERTAVALPGLKTVAAVGAAVRRFDDSPVQSFPPQRVRRGPPTRARVALWVIALAAIVIALAPILANNGSGKTNTSPTANNPPAGAAAAPAHTTPPATTTRHRANHVPSRVAHRTTTRRPAHHAHATAPSSAATAPATSTPSTSATGSAPPSTPVSTPVAPSTPAPSTGSGSSTGSGTSTGSGSSAGSGSSSGSVSVKGSTLPAQTAPTQGIGSGG